MEGVDGPARGVGAGAGVVDGDERKADKAVIWVSDRDDTRDLSGICSRAKSLEEVEWEIP